jgi:hypothetical protein
LLDGRRLLRRPEGVLSRSDRSRLDSLDLQEISDHIAPILERAGEVKHLAFSMRIQGNGYNPLFGGVASNLLLTSLHIASWFPYIPDTFAFLTSSSLSTLRFLRIAWDLAYHPSDFAAFQVLNTLVIHTEAEVPVEQLIQAFPSFPPSLTSLIFAAFYHYPYTDTRRLEQYLPPTLLHLELPCSIDTVELADLVEHLPQTSKLRSIAVTLYSDAYWVAVKLPKPDYASTEEACLARGIAFARKVRLLFLDIFLGATAHLESFRRSLSARCKGGKGVAGEVALSCRCRCAGRERCLKRS